jgi:2'-5' RNA ligase
MTVAAIVDDIKAQLTQAAGAARSEVRWVRMDGLHLTLRFLGATPSERVGELAAAIDAVAADARPFEIRIAGAGAFPSPTRPRTLWLGIIAGKNELKALAAALDAHLEALGWQPEERSFRSHLTLARADGRREGPAAARLLIDRAADVELAFRADNLVLFESVSGSGPARYEPLHVAPLGGAV